MDVNKIEQCILSRKSLMLGFEPLDADPTDLSVTVYDYFNDSLTPVGVIPADKAQKPLHVGVIVYQLQAPGLQGEHARVTVILGGRTLYSHTQDLRSGHDATRTARAAEDAVSYALLTDNISGGTSPVMPTSRLGGSDTGGLAQRVGQTLREVLGWKVRDDDPKGFAGALSASFSISQVEGHTDWTYTPRSYVVQSDLNGGITGAQASLYKRAQDAVDQALPLIDGLYPLDPDADAEDISAVKAVARKQLQELASELGEPSGPSITRVDRFFDLLLALSGESYSDAGYTQLLEPEPDNLGGTLGQLRDLLGLSFSAGFVNGIPDEQNQTNYRLACDLVTSLAQSFLNNRRFFGLNAPMPFLGTQLVPISRQLSVVAESVDDLRFTLDSVFIGAAERQTLRLDFGTIADSLYAEDFFRWIQNFVTDEAPTYVQDGGKFGIGNSVVPFAQRLYAMTNAIVHQPGAPRPLPDGFYTARVQRSIKALADALGELVNLTVPLTRDVVPAPVPVSVRAALNTVRIGLKDGVLSFTDSTGAPTTPSSILYNLSVVPLIITTTPGKSTRVQFVDAYGNPMTPSDTIPLARGESAPFEVIGSTSTQDIVVFEAKTKGSTRNAARVELVLLS
ncbi:hypothetical protein [Paraburkholderia sp. CI3]|uniref:hypothetical protein n=1 Tax=Paraburkholderia sp. CI3 TaxID=2991060 RepID=UPI003D1BDE0D